MEKNITPAALELKEWLNANKNKCFEVEYQDKQDRYNGIVFSDLKFLIKRMLEENGIVVHKNMCCPTDLFVDDNGEIFSALSKTLALKDLDIRTTSNEKLAYRVLNFLITNSAKNFSFYKMDSFLVQTDSFNETEELHYVATLGEPIEVLKIRFASW